MSQDDAVATPPRSRLIAFYAALAILTAVVTAVIISVGSDRKAEPSIAGGYAVAGEVPCVGERIDLKQSGQFVNADNPDETLSGQLRFEDGRLTGDVDCVDGGTQELEATIREGELRGTLGGQPLTAQFRFDPPERGATKARAPDAIDGEYALSPRPACLGGRVEVEKGSGDRFEIATPAGRELGHVDYKDGTLHGEVECVRGGAAEVEGKAVARRLDLALIPSTEDPPAGAEEGVPAVREQTTANKQREFGETLAHFFIAIAAVMLIARLVGMLAVRIGQPRVMGEVVAGIALGPTLLGAFLPDVQEALFPADIIPIIGVVANLGLIFYMFLVGLELDPNQLKGRVGQAAAISNASVALPMMLGIAVALPIFTLVGPPKLNGDLENFVPFALFMGVAMSITAFPVLARILVERRMLKRPVGAIAMACAAIDDVTAWFLIALATAIATAGGGGDVIKTIVLAIVFTLVMIFVVRPLLARVSTAYDEAGRVPGGWIVAIFAGILLSAYATEEIGIALIFGAFVMGMVMPRHAELTEDVTHRIEDFVVTLLLPLFFAFTGLRTNIGLLDRPELWLMTIVLIAVAIVGKLAGAYVAARITGFKGRAAAVIGTLMNTRGLTELIVLNLALEKGVISEALFAMLVIMALVTTFMAGPLLNLLDPKNSFGAPVEEELVEARERSRVSFPAIAVPERAILVAPQSEAAIAQLVGLAEPLARSEPPRELILTRLVRPPRGAAIRGGLQTESRMVHLATEAVHREQARLAEQGIAARAVATISSDPGVDLAKLAKEEEVDLVLVDGRRPLLGEGVPRGDVAVVLHQAPSDVAVVVAREGQEIVPGPDRPVVIPFGNAEHDWAALELGAWVASQTGAPLRLLGAAGTTDEGPRVQRMLGDAGLLVQQYAGIVAEPVVTEPGRESVVDAAGTAGLLVIGLSERWQKEGLGATRSEIARAAPAPTIFVRRGTRPGALAPAGDVTRFTWSSAGIGPGQLGGPGGGGLG
jgi:Kef-type K+ transport system membrane component KefB